MNSLHEGSGPAAVPDFYVKFYELFPEVLPQARLDHVTAVDGFCRSCFKSWPCDIARWVHTLSNVSRPAWHGPAGAGNPQYYLRTGKAAPV